MKYITPVLLSSILFVSASVMAMGNTTEKKPEVTIEAMVDEDYKHGKEAHKNHCYKCHTDSIYTRDESFINSIDALSKQVVRCKEGSSIPWFDEDTETVIHFVNKKFYKF